MPVPPTSPSSPDPADRAAAEERAEADRRAYHRDNEAGVRAIAYLFSGALLYGGSVGASTTGSA